MFGGVPVRVSPLAITTRYLVKRWPIPKRRKGWRVVKRSGPGAYMLAGGLLVIHPDIFAHIPGA